MTISIYGFKSKYRTRSNAGHLISRISHGFECSGGPEKYFLLI